MFKDTDKALARLEAELLREEEDLPEEEYEEYEEYMEESEEDENTPTPPEYVYEDTRPSAGPVIYQNYSNHYGKNPRNYAEGYHVYNTDISDEDLEEYSQELLEEEEEPSRNSTFLALIACLLSLTIAAVVLIWTLLSRGVI